MAITAIRTRLQSRVLGGGFDASGNPKQGKDQAVVALAGTYETGGISLTAADLGFSTVDYVTFEVRTPAPTATTHESMNWDTTNLFSVDQGGTQLADNTTIDVRAFVVGDAARDVELT